LNFVFHWSIVLSLKKTASSATTFHTPEGEGLAVPHTVLFSPSGISSKLSPCPIQNSDNKEIAP
jgi:hypothetical protein